MDKKIKAVFAGGDERYVYAAKRLDDENISALSLGHGENADIYSEISSADAVILPITQSGDTLSFADGRRFSVFEIVRLADGAAFFGGESIFSLAKDKKCFDITKNERFALRNAELTAEGAVGIMINSMPFSVCGAAVAVLGYGWIGAALTKKLCALGAAATVFARRESSRQEARKFCRALDFCDFAGGFDCIINTVPAKALGERGIISADGAYFIELASAPFGFDGEFRARQGDKFIYAPGLPGKTAPMSAGYAVADAVSFILKGES